jgi:hypothetical protein
MTANISTRLLYAFVAREESTSKFNCYAESNRWDLPGQR